MTWLWFMAALAIWLTLMFGALMWNAIDTLSGRIAKLSLPEIKRIEVVELGLRDLLIVKFHDDLTADEANIVSRQLCVQLGTNRVLILKDPVTFEVFKAENWR